MTHIDGLTIPARSGSTPDVSAEAPIRVMLVDDSQVIRRIVAGWLSQLPDVTIVATHENGRRAVDDVAVSRPDVVLLDLEMPEMDGLTALPLLLSRWPGVVVLVASTLSRRGAEVSLNALTLGAADYLTKPEGAGLASADQFKADLITKIRQLGRKRSNRGRTRPGPSAVAAAAPALREGASALKTAAPVASPERKSPLRRYSMSAVRCLVIGSSTGGPQALARVLTDAGSALARVPVLITQHMPPTFTAILAEHLGRATALPAAEARDGEPLQNGRILVAPGGKHMIVARAGDAMVARLNDAPPENFCKPAVDPLFRSMADSYGAGTLAIVLTGMGTDGAKGSVAIANAGGSVIAQDEETSVVWGMPGAAFAAGSCAEVLPLGRIGPRIARMLTGARA